MSGIVPLVSVIIPCYNQAHYLGEAIESVRAQVHRGLEIEIVVVDDGSTDVTRSVAVQYAGVRYHRQRHRGLAAARNAGLRESAGARLVFLDADDRLLPGALQSGADCLARHVDAAFVSGSYRHIDAKGRPVIAPFADAPETPDDLSLLRSNCIGMIASVMFRRWWVVRANGFDTALRACEDWDLYLRIARWAPVRRHTGLVAEYRLHDAGMSRDSARMLRAASAVLRKQRVYAARDPRRLDAWRTGMRWVEQAYGERLLDEVMSARAFSWHVAVRSLATLARHYPRGLARRLFPRLAAAPAHR